jgi:hypothetical protein
LLSLFIRTTLFPLTVHTVVGVLQAVPHTTAFPGREIRAQIEHAHHDRDFRRNGGNNGGDHDDPVTNLRSDWAEDGNV